jgi:hypothetical protein
MDRPLRIYSYQALAPGGHCTMLDPFWGAPRQDPPDPLHGRFDEFYRRHAEILEFSTLEDADIAVLPFDYGHILSGKRSRGEIDGLLARVTAAGKKLLVFCWHDSSERLLLPEPDTIIYRTAIDRSRRRPNEFCLPTFHEDFVDKYLGGELPLREYSARPTVSFCGRAAGQRSGWESLHESIRRLKRELTTGRRDFPYAETRARLLRTLEQSGRVDCRFMVHQAFWGGLGDNAREADVGSRVRARSEYVENMRDSDYVLCIRGAGNFSMRLYETLCMGRIPLIVDTDSYFPFERSIDWTHLGPFVEQGSLATAGPSLISFHQSLGPNRFVEIQSDCRAIWHGFLSPFAFFSRLVDEVSELIINSGSFV